MPKHTCALCGRSSSVNHFIAAAPDDIASFTLANLQALPAEVLRLHLSSRNLVTTRTKAAMAIYLHTATHMDASNDNSPAPLARSYCNSKKAWKALRQDTVHAVASPPPLRRLRSPVPTMTALSQVLYEARVKLATRVGFCLPYKLL